MSLPELRYLPDRSRIHVGEDHDVAPALLRHTVDADSVLIDRFFWARRLW